MKTITNITFSVLLVFPLFACTEETDNSVRCYSGSTLYELLSPYEGDLSNQLIKIPDPIRESGHLGKGNKYRQSFLMLKFSSTSLDCNIHIDFGIVIFSPTKNPLLKSV